MTFQPQRIVTPDGSNMVILAEADYEALVAAAHAAADVADAARVEGIIAEAEASGYVPGEVVDAMLDGTHPVKAWRQWRGMTQAELARRTGLAQGAIARIEAGGYGRLETRRKLADALEAPLAALDPVA